MAAPPTNADNAMAETITFAVRIEFSLSPPAIPAHAEL